MALLQITTMAVLRPWLHLELPVGPTLLDTGCTSSPTGGGFNGSCCFSVGNIRTAPKLSTLYFPTCKKHSCFLLCSGRFQKGLKWFDGLIYGLMMVNGQGQKSQREICCKSSERKLPVEAHHPSSKCLADLWACYKKVFQDQLGGSHLLAGNIVCGWLNTPSTSTKQKSRV